jgi:hypothetical protein
MRITSKKHLGPRVGVARTHLVDPPLRMLEARHFVVRDLGLERRALASVVPQHGVDVGLGIPFLQ